VSAAAVEHRVDVDVHPLLSTTLAAIFAYLPRAQRERVAYLGDLPLQQAPTAMSFLIGRWAVGRNAEPPPGDRPASSPERLLAELGPVAAAQLVPTDAPAHALQSRNYDLAAALTSAFNDYLLEHWAGGPLRLALAVTPDDPAAAVAEIRRHADDPRVSAVWIPGGQRRLGDRHYDPVYAAAVDCGLPILVHPGGPKAALAPPEYALEARFNAPQAAWAQLANVVALGAAERHPQLVFVFAECGFAWLPALLRRMDAAWSAARPRVPELVRAPSEVVRAQVRVATGPFDDDRAPDEIAALAEELADVLVYASNHPRGGGADALSGLPEQARRRILSDNARAALRLDR
jgi:predicted TIM-barrel fold metal-dependent hydrolase